MKPKGKLYAIILPMVEAPIISGIREFISYAPTLEERRQGLMSSIHSEGAVGFVNRTLAKAFRQEQADIKAFLSYIIHPLPS